MEWNRDLQVPFHQLLGIEIVSLDDGLARLRLRIEEKHLRVGGIVHGGVIATLLDAGVGIAAKTTAQDADVVTMQLNLNLIRPGRVGDELSVEGRVVHAGRRTAVAQVEIHTADGSLVATGSGTAMFLREGA
jgi:acyl-CoA thioesterase